MKKVKVENSVGQVLCHDMTQIIPGKYKGPRFKKGHVVKKEDIPVLKTMGKEYLYIWEKQKGKIHENEAVCRIRDAVTGDNISTGKVSEGKITFTSSCDGLLKINKEKLNEVNSIDKIAISTIRNNTPVKKGDQLAATRVIPLVIEEEPVKKMEDMMQGLVLFEVKPYNKVRAVVLTTGNEVYSGRVADAFGPVIVEKLGEYGGKVIVQELLPDEMEQIIHEIKKYDQREDIDIILCTGGMSVDPDDITPMAIRSTGSHIVTYGAPVFPGAMFLLAYSENNKTIMGLPGCVMYAKRTVFDLVLPRILAGERLTKEDIVNLGHGGLCLNCATCRFPYCCFGNS
jgi:molybdenum cofactor synthesis domain-containing protein